ncbi:MAG: MarR family transcriptional regulator [Candidatus Peribacteraceae bacterium]|nr:MarR family transcriptional regulator [Candidatus Peribacteraceae bacterium]
MNAMLGKSPLDRIIDTTFDLSRVFRHVMMDMAKEGTTVNFLQIHVLAIVGEQKGITMKELAGILRIASPSATSFVHRLVKMGWLRREHDSRNRKLVRLRLTEKGRAVLREKTAKRTAIITAILSTLSPAEQQSLARILVKLHRSCADFHRVRSPLPSV